MQPDDTHWREPERTGAEVLPEPAHPSGREEKTEPGQPAARTEPARRIERARRFFAPATHPAEPAGIVPNEPSVRPAAQPCPAAPPAPQPHPPAPVGTTPEVGYRGPPPMTAPPAGWRPPRIVEPPPPRHLPWQDHDVIDREEKRTRTLTQGVGIVVAAILLIVLCALCGRALF